MRARVGDRASLGKVGAWFRSEVPTCGPQSACGEGVSVGGQQTNPKMNSSSSVLLG